MSFSVTGIQAIPVNVFLASFAQGGYGSGLTTQSNNNTGTNANQSGAVAPTASDTVALSTPNKFQALTKPEPAQSTAAPKDTVELSTVQKVRTLQQQGASTAQIAATLNLPVKEVESDLHVDARVAQLVAAVAVANTPVSVAAATSTAA